MDRVEIGTTGLLVSQLCFGTGTQGWRGRSNQTDLGLDELADLLHYGYDRGINFWDSADQYGSHPHVARALQNIDRDTVVITSKTCATTSEEAEADIDRFLRELNTESIYIVLMHCLTEKNWPTVFSGVMDVLEIDVHGSTQLCRQGCRLLEDQLLVLHGCFRIYLQRFLSGGVFAGRTCCAGHDDAHGCVDADGQDTHDLIQEAPLGIHPGDTVGAAFCRLHCGRWYQAQDPSACPFIFDPSI